MHSLKALIVPKLALVILAAMMWSTQSLAATGSGSVLLPGVSSAVPGNAVLCFNSSTGQLGPCAPGIVVTPPCVDPNNRFMDCGDGTVYDKQTGLMWERKEDCGGGVNLVNPHCRANTYTWSAVSPFTEPSGTLFSDFAAKLNGLNESTGIGGAPCFAGHCDWRIPTVGELQTILASCPGGGLPCISAIFGPTQASNYWSSSSLASFPNTVWLVYFFNGSVGYDLKAGGGAFYARAVRSGR